MNAEDAKSYLVRYNRWRRGDRERDFEEAGFSVKEVGDAMDALIYAHTCQTTEIRSLKARLARCQVQRERAHSELRKLTCAKKHERVLGNDGDGE